MQGSTQVLAALLLMTITTGALSAQMKTASETGAVPRAEVSLGYSYIHANAPPGGCGCFSLNGGAATGSFNLAHGVSVIADFSAGHASQIAGTTQNVTIYDYLFGPRYSYRSRRRTTPYAETLLGASHESSNYAYVASVTGFALLVGGGVDLSLKRRISLNLVEADYIYSRIANASNNSENDLRIRTGVTLRFGTR